MKRLTTIRTVIVLALVLTGAIAAGPAQAARITAQNNYDGKWHRSPFTVTIIAVADPGFVVGAIDWSFDGPVQHNPAPPLKASWTIGVPIATPSDHSRDGNHRLYYEAVGVPPTTTGQIAQWIGIDTRAPVTTPIGGGGADLTLWHNHALAVTLTASDGASGVSGVATLRYKVGSAGWVETAGTTATVNVSSQGSTRIDYNAVDNAVPGGNAEAQKSVTAKVDLGAPATTVSGGSGVDLTQWHDHAITLTFTGGDPALIIPPVPPYMGQIIPLSGVAKTEYKVDSGSWTTGTSTTISSDGDHTVLYRSVDNAGNLETAKTVHVKIDRTPPAVIPHIASLTPDHGLPGASVTIAGSGFGAAQGSGSVQFGATSAVITSWSATSITCQVPAMASAAAAVAVAVGTATSNAVAITVEAPMGAPHIASLTPSHGLPAASVIIAGDGFGAAQGSGSVQFGATSAVIISWSATSIACLVPAIASGATSVAVTVDALTSNAVAFTVEGQQIVPSVTLKLSGPFAGVLKLGRRVTTKCTVTPSSMAGESCRLTMQKKKGSRWAKVAGASWKIGPIGIYSWKYKPGTRGSYRVQATITATAQHTAARTPWRAFRVK
jgi:hypothetical protein